MSYGQPFITELKASVDRLTKEVEKLNGELSTKDDEIISLKKAAKKSTSKKTTAKKPALDKFGTAKKPALDKFGTAKKPALDKFGTPKIVSIEALTESSDPEEKLDS